MGETRGLFRDNPPTGKNEDTGVQDPMAAYAAVGVQDAMAAYAAVSNFSAEAVATSSDKTGAIAGYPAKDGRAAAVSNSIAPLSTPATTTAPTAPTTWHTAGMAAEKSTASE